MPTEEGFLGSAESNELVLPFAGVSRRHARFEPVGEGLRLIDLGSKNGLVVGGERVPEVVLKPGGSVRIGYAELLLAEVAASDFELALPLGEVEGSTEVVAGDLLPAVVSCDEASARQAVVLVKEIESSSPRALAQRRTAFLEHGRTILGAEWLALVDLADPARPAVQELAGPLADDELDRLFAEIPPSRRGRSTTRSTVIGRWLVCTRSGAPLALVACFVSTVGSESSWRQALVEYLLSKLGGAGGVVDPGEAEPASGDLRIPDGMVLGPSAATRELLQQVRSSLASRADVLLLGESGTGKELFARLLHASGPKARGPFQPVSCPALPGELLEAELFGVTDRAATGVAARPGHFVSAHGGTLLLDEIGDMPPGLQAKLLRVLQEREVWPLGASQARKVDVRVIAATNRDLPAMVRDGSFRADLYYRLRQLEIRVPALRERREDIPALVLAFARRFAVEYHKSLRGVSRRALELLMAYDWPGNVRDLESEILRAVVACPSGDLLRSEHLHLPEPTATDNTSPSSVSTGFSPAARSGLAEGPERAERHARIDREAIRRALEATSGNKAAAARLLDLSREGLRKKMKRLGLG